MRWMSSLSCLAALAALSLAALPASHAHADAIAHWTFDELDDSGNYPDAIDNAHPATPVDRYEVLVYNGPNPAPFGKAVTFQGPSHPNSYLTIPPLTNIQTTSFTVAAWVNLVSPNAAFVLTDWPSMTQSAYAFGFHPFSPGRNTAQPNGNITSTEVSTGRGGGSRRSIVDQKLPDRAVVLNEWHHVAWIWDRDLATLTFYYDGTIWGEHKHNPTPPNPNYSKSLDIAVNNTPVRIGSQQLNLDNRPANLSGSMDELWIFNEPLTSIQIRNLREYNDIKGKPAPVAPTPTPTPSLSPVPNPSPVGVAPAPTPTPAPITPTTKSIVATASSDPVEPATKSTRSLAGVTPPPGGLGVGRLIGIISCLLVIILMASYLTWAFVERAKLQARRA